MNEKLQDIIMRNFDPSLSHEENFKKLVMDNDFPIPMNEEDDGIIQSQLRDFLKEINDEIDRRQR